ncbi:hypothetical protein ZWY2020_045901 [Hordeum vulgare]|nr:hypothetical protein ZWY2020_045901 [Hordeum vulgare]
MVTTAAAAGKAKMAAMATTAAAGMAEMKKQASATITAATNDNDNNNNNNTSKAIILAAPPSAERPNIFVVISRLADRPFLGADASEKLKTLGRKLSKMMAAVEAARTMIKASLAQLLDDLDAAFHYAELALDEVEQQHLCLQALIMSHEDDKKNLASKLRFGVRRSRMKARIQRRRDEVQGIVNKAYRRVVGSKKKPNKLDYYY